MVHLNFNEDLSYQQYLEFKTMIMQLDTVAVKTSPIEFVFDPEKVPDCGCK